jgi:hypothetical protein
MKKRQRRSDPQKQVHWEEVVRRWQESGQSVRGYCRAEGIRESAFYFWRAELQRRPSSDAVGYRRSKASRVMPAARLAKRLSPPPQVAPSFLPVHIVERGEAETPTPGGVEIMLAQGRMVRVREGFDRQTLADVLAVLEARSC